MKSYGSIMYFTKERNNELLKAYKKVIKSVSQIRLKEIGVMVVNSPSPRFWVSEERATTVISSMLKGKDVLSSMRQSKREMFQEIYRRVVELRKLKKYSSQTLSSVVFAVVNSPAPKFYMKSSSAIEILFKVRNGYYERIGKY